MLAECGASFGLAWLACVALLSLWHARTLFGGARGRPHRLLGAAELHLLGLGYADVLWPPLLPRAALDIGLGLLGALLSVTALAFGHARVSRQQHSGTLDPHATVSRGEMIEHVFFQLLNAAQLALLHALGAVEWRPARLLLCWAAAWPWLARSRFPVNSFSRNYDERTADPRSTRVTRFLYRAKKWQYVGLKHALQFGLNVSVALCGTCSGLTDDPVFRLYFLALSTSFVAEFYLQTLVKRGLLSQAAMLVYQAALMLMASVTAAVTVWRYVLLPIAALSMALNFANRGHDVFNTAVLILVSQFVIVIV